MAKKRDYTIDLLRAWATVSILLTHAEVPRPFYYIRPFEVVSLMFLSSMSFALSRFEFTWDNYRSYTLKRLWRIVKPLWIMLTFFFILFIFVFHIPFTWKEILMSYAMTSSGIGLVWIYRIYCTTAITMPLFRNTALTKPVWLIVACSIGLFLLNDYLYYHVLMNSKLLTYIITYTVAYTICSVMGMMNVRLSGKERYTIGGIFLAIAAIYFYITKNPDVEAFKYPPELYFCSYGLAMSFILYQVFSKVHFNETFLKVIVWISGQAMNVYLWHIIFYHLESYGIVKLPHTFPVLFTYYIITAFGATYIAYKVKGLVHKNG